MVLLRVDPGLVIWLWITFGIVMVVLRLTAWKPITAALDKRSQRIARDLEAARQAGERAGAVQSEYEQKLREGREEAARIIEQARTDASRLRETMLQQSHAEAREVRDRALHEIELAREDAERALRGEVISLSFSIADSILKRETGSPDNRAFVEEFADRLLSASGAGPARN